MLLRRVALFTIFILCCAFMANSTWVSSASPTPKPAPVQVQEPTAAAGALSDPFTTAEGMVRGEVAGNSIIFRGIPYASAPTGNLRWKPPQPASQRSQILDAINFGSPCSQPGGNGVVGSEDCLTLNIWTPKTAESTARPVMFFIHGGGNITGSADFKTFGALVYDGQYMEENSGVIVVTINYRLGPLGFLGHPALSAEDSVYMSSGNYGLMDQIAALQWVQRNIRNFGGDPNNVTIFGESAGGRNVISLVTSPLAAGLFHKAIAESPAPVFVEQPLHVNGTGNSAEDLGLRISKSLGCEATGNPVDCLRSKSPLELLNAIPPDELGVNGLMYGPNVDGYVLPIGTAEALQKGLQNNVPMMIGTNKDEFLGFIGDTPLNSESDYRAALRLAFGDDSSVIDQIVKRYPLSDYGSPTLALNAVITDAVFLCPARKAVSSVAANQPKTFFYQFTHALTALPDMGAFHGLELPFVFHSITNISLLKLTKKEVKLTNNMVKYWTNFAKTGDPNGSGLPKWPAYTVDGDMNITLDTKIKTNKNLRKDFCDFLSQFTSKGSIACGCGE